MSIFPTRESKVHLPYIMLMTVDTNSIVKDKIGDVSIKLQFSQEESWTRALRHVLLALKLLLKLVTNTNPA